MEKSEDLELYNRFKNGDKLAFAEIVKKYENLVYTICKQELESGKSGIHKKMLSGYKNVIEDIRNEVWIRLLGKLEKGMDFHDRHSLLNLLRDISVKTTKSKKTKSIRNRNPESVSKSEKIRASSKKLVSNSFESTDHRENADRVDMEAIVMLNEIYHAEDEKRDIDEIYEEISEKLTVRQCELIRLMEAQILSNGEDNHLFLAKKLGVSERTIRNDLRKIRELYLNLE